MAHVKQPTTATAAAAIATAAHCCHLCVCFYTGSADAAVIPSGIGGFIACKALSKRNTDPATASRPWDKERDGFVMGEGAGGWVVVCDKEVIGTEV